MLADFDRLAWQRVFYRGVPCCAILLGAISLERAGMQPPKLLATLGDSSYGLYLVHPFMLPALGKSWFALHLVSSTSPGLLFVAAFCASLAAGHAAYLVIEKPLTRWLGGIAKSAAQLNFRQTAFCPAPIFLVRYRTEPLEGIR